MSLVTLAEAKAQCRVTHNLENDLITLYMNTAEEYIADYLNLPAAPKKYRAKAAALLIIHDLYNNRGAQTENQLYKNQAAENLLFPMRTGMGI